MRVAPTVLASLAAVSIAFAPPPSRAQSPIQTQSRYLAEEDATDAHAAFLHFATQYSEATVAGVLAGGLLINLVIGGLPATLGGAVGGALLASWLYVDQASSIYVVRELH